MICLIAGTCPTDLLQLANQFVASLFYVHKHHDYATLGPNDTVRQEAKNDGDAGGKEQDGTSQEIPRRTGH